MLALVTSEQQLFSSSRISPFYSLPAIRMAWFMMRRKHTMKTLTMKMKVDEKRERKIGITQPGLGKYKGWEVTEQALKT